MKLETCRPEGLLRVLRSRRFHLPGSLIGLVVLIALSIVHYIYPNVDRGIETWIGDTLRGHGYRFFDGITELGNITLLLPVALVIFLVLLWLRNWQEAVRLAVIVFGGALFGFILKLAYSQSGSVSDSTPSARLDLGFPSGHTMMALLFFGWLVSFLIHRIRDDRWKWVVISSGAGLILLIGVSRLMISVHLPTDVLSGWVAGGIWMIISLWLSDWLIKTILPSIQNWFSNHPNKK